jgi:fucose 4-O-acetylase-like acetyltransferase
MKLINSDFVYSNQRQGWIDYDRGISIILVTYRHVFESLNHAGFDLEAYPFLGYINVFFFGFRMPLFFIASGIFIRNGIKSYQLKGYLGNRIKTILYPMLLWGIIQISLQIIFSDYTNSADSINYKTYIYLITDPRVTGQFWYLNALFFVGVIYAFTSVKFHFNALNQLGVGLILYSISAYIHRLDIDLGAINDVLKYYLFFSIGDAISKYIMQEQAKQWLTSPKVMFTLIAGFIINQYFFTRMNLAAGTSYHIENQWPLFFLLVALTGCALSLSISFKLTEIRRLKFLRVIGYNSVHIYCMQIIIMSAARVVCSKFFHLNNPILLTLFMLTAGIMIPIFIYNICLRMQMWWWFTLKKPKAELEFIRKD